MQRWKRAGTSNRNFQSLICTAICSRLKRRRAQVCRTWPQRFRLRLILATALLGCAFYLLPAGNGIKTVILTALTFRHGNGLDANSLRGIRLIFTADTASWFNARIAMDSLRSSECPVLNCRVTSNERMLPFADAVVFRSAFDSRLVDSYSRPNGQSWIFLSHEAAIRERAGLADAGRRFNFTVTYLRESTIYLPYWTYVAHADWNRNLTHNADPQVVATYRNRNHDATSQLASQKRGKVAWLVSNCHDVQNDRFEYAEQLAKYIALDIYGDCGIRCFGSSRQDCFDFVAQHYKFYLAFENANCIEYISEKLLNAFNMGLLPIVMGARPIDYKRLAPPHSFIHIEDFRGPQHLAEYLLTLDSDATLYDAYFDWRKYGIVAEPRFLGPNYWCQICMLVNNQANRTAVKNSMSELDVDIATWWTKDRCLRKGKLWKSATPEDFA